ncbi:MAG: hypothetical protein JW866_11420 [Ignavibacteriales bacterium]|nr:hypothetical protein [Ignavibacteriales bacterium]
MFIITRYLKEKIVDNFNLYFSSIYEILFHKKSKYIKYFFIGLFLGALGNLTQELLDYEFKEATTLGDAFLKICKEVWLTLPGWSKFLVYSLAGGILGIFYKIVNRRHRTKKVFILSQPQIFNLLYQLEDVTKGGGYEKELYIENLKKDKLILSPLDYSIQTISQSKAPEFYADDKYILELYDNSVKSIVAITSWSPSMWIDPALSFYLINTCLVSLKHDLNSNITDQKKNEIDLFNMNHNEYKEFYNKKMSLLKTLGEFDGKFNSLNVIRFFLLEPEWIDAYAEQYLSALYAIHDLFRIKAYFIDKSRLYTKLLENNLFNSYENNILNIWSKFEHSDPSLKEGLKRKKRLPEFLMLWGFDDCKIHIWSYLSGKPISISGKTYPELCNDSSNLIKCISNSILDDPRNYLFEPTSHKLRNENGTIVGWK